MNTVPGRNEKLSMSAGSISEYWDVSGSSQESIRSCYAYFFLLFIRFPLWESI